MTKKLDGKIAVITGGSEGIGLATAKRFVAEGAYVFVTGRRQTELDRAVTEIGSKMEAPLSSRVRSGDRRASLLCPFTTRPRRPSAPSPATGSLISNPGRSELMW